MLGAVPRRFGGRSWLASLARVRCSQGLRLLAGSYSWDGLAFRYDGKKPPLVSDEKRRFWNVWWDDLARLRLQTSCAKFAAPAAQVRVTKAWPGRRPHEEGTIEALWVVNPRRREMSASFRVIMLARSLSVKLPTGPFTERPWLPLSLKENPRGSSALRSSSTVW